MGTSLTVETVHPTRMTNEIRLIKAKAQLIKHYPNFLSRSNFTALRARLQALLPSPAGSGATPHIPGTLPSPGLRAALSALQVPPRPSCACQHAESSKDQAQAACPSMLSPWFCWDRSFQESSTSLYPTLSGMPTQDKPESPFLLFPSQTAGTEYLSPLPPPPLSADPHLSQEQK